MVDISVIVPVYNSEKYLSNTIESILSQSFENFELILVDDGSKDSSGKICDRLAEKDKRVKVIHKKNEGICATRNKGLEIADGRYIAFCDNDDYYLEDLLKDNLSLADKYDADVVRFSRRRTDMCDNRIISVKETKGFDTCYIPEEKFAENYEKITKAGEGVWAGIYKKEFLDKYRIRFNEKMRYGYEDLDFITQIYLQHPSIVLNKNVYYHWIMRSNHSTSAKTNMNNIESLMSCLVQKKILFQEYGMEQSKFGIWMNELSARICQVIKYVSPQKTKMKLKERMNVLRYFATCEVFQMKYGLGDVCKHIKQVGMGASIILYLFIHHHYLMVYLMVLGKNRIIQR